MLAQRTNQLIFTIAGGFLFLDQYLKWLSVNVFTKSVLFKNLFGWQPFINKGVAFGLPLPNLLVIILTLLIVGILLWHILVNRKYLTVYWLFGHTLVLVGGLSNLFDRVVFGHAIDYLRIFTSVINLADIMIVAGFMLILFFNKKELGMVN